MKIANAAPVLALLRPSFGADVDPRRGARAEVHLRGLRAETLSGSHRRDLLRDLHEEGHQAPPCIDPAAPGGKGSWGSCLWKNYECCEGFECNETNGACVEPASPDQPSCALLDKDCDPDDVVFGQGTCCKGFVCWPGEETCAPEGDLVDLGCIQATEDWADIPCDGAAISCCPGLECFGKGERSFCDAVSE